MVRAVGENNFQPKIGFKTRYGLVANTFATTNADGEVIPGQTVDTLAGDLNVYYRAVSVKNLM